MYLWRYLKSELGTQEASDFKESEYNQKRENVFLFLRLPWALEKVKSLFIHMLDFLGANPSAFLKFMFYGFLQCADSFLYVCSLLPLRIITLFIQIFQNPFQIFTNLRKLSEPSRVVDFCKLILIIGCYYLLTFIDTSMVYHIIRGQAIIKLYIFFNMLEVADRLLCSIGQDILDALFWTATEPKKLKILVLPYLLLAVIYVFAHSIVILCQTTTLNVAFNSYNKALLTIMMSNNFVELKGSVFKKFDKNNVLQMSCSDVKERFYNLILLLIIFIRNMAEFDWQLDQFYELIPVFCTIFFSEFFIDWIKHAFVLKFNNISPDVFFDFKVELSYGMMHSKEKKDHYDLQSHYYGFIPIPLFCLLFRICTQSIKISNQISYLNLALGFLCLLFLKLLNHVLLLGLSCKAIENSKNRVIPEKNTEKKKEEPSPKPVIDAPKTDNKSKKKKKALPKGIVFSSLIRHKKLVIISNPSRITINRIKKEKKTSKEL